MMIPPTFSLRCKLRNAAEFDGLYEEGGLYPFVLHPQIIGRVSRVKMLEDLLTYMKSRPGTLIGPGKVIADAARKALMPEA